MMNIMKIGYIGFGEAAYNISQGLYEEGILGIRATDTMMNHPSMGKQIHARAEHAHVALVESSEELVQWADIIFAAVPSTYTMDVCDAVKDSLTSDKIYVDVSASTPKTKEKIWDAIEGSGALFVDAAMLGSLPAERHKVPITASGNGAIQFKECMEPYGMRITLAGDRPGAASAIKLIRSIYMKGIAALMIEMLQAADAYQVSNEIICSIAESMDSTPFVPTMNRLVTGTAIHCTRRAAELKGSIQLLEDAELNPEIVVASKHIHESLADYHFAEQNAENKIREWQEIIEAIRS